MVKPKLCEGCKKSPSRGFVNCTRTIFELECKNLIGAYEDGIEDAIKVIERQVLAPETIELIKQDIYKLLDE